MGLGVLDAAVEKPLTLGAHQLFCRPELLPDYRMSLLTLKGQTRVLCRTSRRHARESSLCRLFLNMFEKSRGVEGGIGFVRKLGPDLAANFHFVRLRGASRVGLVEGILAAETEVAGDFTGWLCGGQRRC